MSVAIKVLGVSGSPRVQSTDFAVNLALQLLRERGCETKYYSVSGKDIRFCTHCDYCIRTREGCVFKDDVQKFYDEIIWADGVVFGTPVYQGNLSGQLKTVMDRCRAILAKDPNVLKGKIGMGIAVGGDRNGGQEIALRAMHDFFIINEMTPVGGGSWGANLGATFWSQDRGKVGLEGDAEGFRTLRKTVKKFYEMLERTKGASVRRDHLIG
jgi:multimeric flavodoxin WrbA